MSSNIQDCMLFSRLNIALFGAILMFAGGYLPLLNVSVINRDFNLWNINIYLAVFWYLLAVLGVVATIANRASLVKYVGLAAFILVPLLYGAVYFAISHPKLPAISYAFPALALILSKPLATAVTGAVSIAASAIARHLVDFVWLGWGSLMLGSVLIFFPGTIANAFGEKELDTNNSQQVKVADVSVEKEPADSFDLSPLLGILVIAMIVGYFSESILAFTALFVGLAILIFVPAYILTLGFLLLVILGIIGFFFVL